MLLHVQEPSTFREPYPVANPPMAPVTFVHSPNPQLILGDNPLVSMTRRLTPAEVEYLLTLRLMPPMVRDASQVPNPAFLAAPQLQPMYVPTWPTAQLGPLPPMPLTQPAPFPVSPTPVAPPTLPFQAPPAVMPAPPVAPPAAPPQYFGYPHGGWGPMPNYYPDPAQPYPISYPLGPWPPYQQPYTGPHGHVEEDSKTTSSLVGTP